MTYRFLTGEHFAFEPAVKSLESRHTPYCWGCGPEADNGLGLRPWLDGSRVRADLEFARMFEGGPNAVHGGAITGFLDDLLGYVPIAYGAPGVTARLDTNFIEPVPIEVSVQGSAWMSRVDGLKMWAEGTIERDGRVLVEASALFVAIDFEHFEKVFDRLSDDHKERATAYRPEDHSA